jgi:hypothetical protein
MKNEAKMDEVRKAVTNYDISDKKERKFLFRETLNKVSLSTGI